MATFIKQIERSTLMEKKTNVFEIVEMYEKELELCEQKYRLANERAKEWKRLAQKHWEKNKQLRKIQDRQRRRALEKGDMVGYKELSKEEVQEMTDNGELTPTIGGAYIIKK